MCLRATIDRAVWKLYEVKVMSARSRVLGEEHPDTLTAVANLAHTKGNLRRNEVAIDVMTR
jgi:hypothetical protein